MINKFTSLIQLKSSHLTTRSWWDVLRNWISLWILLVGIWFPLSAQETIVQLSLEGNNGGEEFVVFDADDVVAPGILTGADEADAIIRRGPGLQNTWGALLNGFAPDSYMGCAFTTATELDENDYFEVVLRFADGVVVNLSEFKFHIYRFTRGPTNINVRTDLTGTTNLLDTDDLGLGSTEFTIDLTASNVFVGLTDSVVFKIYGWDADDSFLSSDDSRCMSIENTDDLEVAFDIEFSGCINFPVTPSFTNPNAAGDTICSEEGLAVSLSTSDDAGEEGTDFQFLLDNIQHITAEGDTLDGYGPVEGLLEVGQILEGEEVDEPQLYDEPVNNSAEVVELIYSVKTDQLGDGFEDCDGAVEQISVFVAPLPVRPDVNFLNPTAFLDTICSGDTLDVTFDLPDVLSELEDGEYEFRVWVIRNDTLPPFNKNEGTEDGYGAIVPDTMIVVGDTVTDGLKVALTNPTDKAIRLSFFVETQLAVAPACTSRPARLVSVVVLPEPAETDVFWVVNGDTIRDADIKVCETDTVQKIVLNEGIPNMLGKYVINDTMDIFEVGIDPQYENILILPGEGLNDDLGLQGDLDQEHYADNGINPQFYSELIAKNEGKRYIEIAFFVDENKNGVLDPYEEACPGDTVTCTVEVTPLPYLTEVELDTVCHEEPISIEVTTEDGELVAGEDYVIEIVDVFYDSDVSPLADSVGQGYGPLMVASGDSLIIGDTLTSPLTQTLTNATAGPVRLTYRVQAKLIDSPECISPTIDVEVLVIPELPSSDISWVVNGDTLESTDIMVCETDTVTKIIVNNGDPWLLVKYEIEDTADVFFLADELKTDGVYSVEGGEVDGGMHLNGEIEEYFFNQEQIAKNGGTRNIKLYLFTDANRNGILEPFEESCESDTIECSVSVTPLPYLVNQVESDSLCSGDILNIDFATQDESLVLGEDYYLEITSIRHDVDEDPFNNPLSPGQGYGPLMIQEGDSLKLGDTLQSTFSQVLVNTTSKPVRMRYRVKAVLMDKPDCESPEVNYEFIIWPKAPAYDLAFMVNGEVVNQDTVVVCVGDVVSNLFINLSDSTDMLVDATLGIDEIEYVAAGDTLIGEPITMENVNTFSLSAVNFPDANQNEILDEQEEECVGDTLSRTLIVIDAPQITMQPEPVLDTVCQGEELTYSVMVDNESNVWEGTWQCFSPGEKDFEDLEGETETTLNVIVGDPDKFDGAKFRFAAYNQCDTVYSDEVEVILRDRPTFIKLPTDFIACKGDSVELTVRATSTDTLICQIEQNGVFRTDKTVNAIEPKAIEKTFKFEIDTTIRLRFIAANECVRDTGDVLTITVPDSVKITHQPGDYATCQGDSVSFLVGVIAENGGEWQYWNETTWESTEVSDTILTYLDVMGEMDGRMFRYCAYNECDTVYSDTVTLSVDTACDLSITDPCNCLANESEPGAGDGQFSETFEITGPEGLIIVIGAGSEGLYDKDSDQPPMAATPLSVGDTIPETAPGVYTLEIRALNNEEYTLNVAINDTNTIIPDLTVTKACGYETPIVSLQPSDTLVCVGDTVTFTTYVSMADSISIQTKMVEDDHFVEVKGVGGLEGNDSTETYTINSVLAGQDKMMVRVVAYNCGTAISDSSVLNVLNVSAGTLIPATITCMDTALDLFAVTGDTPIVPDGFDTVYVLTSTDSLVIEATNDHPFFTVSDTGTYRIHTLIAELDDTDSDNYLNLGVVEPGVTLATEVLSIIAANNICADLDAAGALFEVERCNTIGECDNVTITCELYDWDADDKGASPYNHALYFYESLINGHKGDDSLANRFTLDGVGQVLIKNDTAIVTGTTSSKLDTTAKLDMMLVLTNPRNWMHFSNDGGSWLAQRPDAVAVAEHEYPNWTYWIIDTTSRVVGMGSLAGTYLNLTHAPADSSKAMQQGKGANDKDGDIGLAGWFSYEGNVVYNGDTTYINSQGDLNSDYGKCDTICDLPIVGPIVTGFSVQAVSNDAVQISWGTLTEGNSGYVVVERSIDGQIYEQVAVMEGDDAAFNPENHMMTDVQDQPEGTFFYRLKVVKPDGTYIYTNVVEVSMGGLSKNTYLVYPNPTEDGTFNIRVVNPKSGPHYYEIYDLDGRRLIRDELNVYRTQVDVSRLTSGTYFLRIIDPEGEEFSQRMAVKP